MPRGVPKAGKRNPKRSAPQAQPGEDTAPAVAAQGIGATTPKKSAKKNKAEAAQHGPTPETFLKHLAICTNALTAQQEAQGIYRAALKKAKSDGVPPAEIINAISVRKQDVDEVALNLKQRVYYTQIALGTQFNLFARDTGPVLSQEDQERRDEWAATQEGYASGKSGGMLDSNPYKAGSAAHPAWAKGWHNGQAQIAKEMGPGGKVAPIRKRGSKKPTDVEASSEDEEGGASRRSAPTASQPRLLQ